VGFGGFLFFFSLVFGFGVVLCVFSWVFFWGLGVGVVLVGFFLVWGLVGFFVWVFWLTFLIEFLRRTSGGLLSPENPYLHP